MLTFSSDGPTADKQMRAVIFYLTTFGYIDGDFDASEKSFVKEYIEKLVAHRVAGAVSEQDPKLRQELTTKFTKHFHEVFEGIDRQVRALFDEAVAAGEKQDDFVHAKLKLHCFEIFKSFDAGNQEQLMDTIDELIQADGQVHPAEAKFRGELADLLEEDLGVELLDDEAARPPVAIAEAGAPVPATENHPFFDQFEHNCTADRDRLMQQVQADEALMDKVMAVLDWELSTLGDPLADFTYHLMQWVMPPTDDGSGTGSLVGHDLAALGIPSLDDYVAAYCKRTGRDGLPDLNRYFAYNFFRLAAILQGIVGRVRDGTATNANAAAMAKQVTPLAKAGWDWAQRAGAA